MHVDLREMLLGLQYFRQQQSWKGIWLEPLTALPSEKWRVILCAIAAADDAMDAMTMGRATATFMVNRVMLKAELSVKAERKDRNG